MTDPDLEAIREKKLEQLKGQFETKQAPSAPITLDPGSLDEAIHRHDLLLLDLWAPWCGPCRRLAPRLEQIAAERQGQLVVGKLNVDEHPEASQRFEVQGIPTMLVFKDGEMVDRIVGVLPKRELDARLDQHRPDR